MTFGYAKYILIDRYFVYSSAVHGRVFLLLCDKNIFIRSESQFWLELSCSFCALESHLTHFGASVVASDCETIIFPHYKFDIKSHCEQSRLWNNQCLRINVLSNSYVTYKYDVEFEKISRYSAQCKYSFRLNNLME